MEQSKRNKFKLRMLCVCVALVLASCCALALSACDNASGGAGQSGSVSGGTGSGGASKEDPAFTYYTVTYDFGGVMENKTERVKAGTFLTPETPDLEFFTFVGWFTSPKFSMWHDFDDPVYSDLTIYARFFEKSLDRETFFKRFNEEQKTIPAEKQNISKVWLSGNYYTVDVEGGVNVEKHEKSVTDGFTSFDVPTGTGNYINYFIRLFYSENTFKTDFYDNADYEIIDESYVFHKEGNSGFTVVYKQKSDGNVYKLMTNLDEYHRLNAALFSIVLGADEHGHGTDVNFYMVFANYEN